MKEAFYSHPDLLLPGVESLLGPEEVLLEGGQVLGAQPLHAHGQGPTQTVQNKINLISFSSFAAKRPLYFISQSVVTVSSVSTYHSLKQV